MNGMRSPSPATDSQSRFSRKRSRTSVLEIDSWMPSKIQAISPLADRLMRLIEGETSSVSSWRYAKPWEMRSCTAIAKIQKQKYTFAVAAGPPTKYPAS